MPNALARPLWRGRTNVDALTIAAIEYAEKLAGRTFVITQGSYQSTVAASAGTHDRGGVVDLRWTGNNDDIRALRLAGFAAWHRTPSQGPWPDHIHAVLTGHPDLAPSAGRQVEAYRANRNGLANNGSDDGPRVTAHPRTNWWPPQEEDDMFEKDDSDRLARIEAKLDRSIKADAAIVKRLKALREKVKGGRVDLREVADDVDAILAERES